MSALSLMAANENRWLKLSPSDIVILSSHPIPGNESNVTKVIDGLIRLGAEVVHSGIADVHATGHAKEEELKTFLSIAQPEWFVPVHGEYRHLVAHAKLGRADGRRRRPRASCARTATSSCSTTTASARTARCPAGYLYVDGIVGDVGHGVLRDRRVLAEEGVVVVIVAVDVDDRRHHHRPRDHHPGLGLRPRGRGPARRVRRGRSATRSRRRSRTTPPTSRPCSAVVRRAAGRFVSDRTKRGP